MIFEKVALYSDFNYTDEARIAFSNKLSAYTGEEINIEPIQYADKTDDISEEDIFDEGIKSYESQIEIPADIV